MNEQLIAIIETLKTLKVDPTFSNVDKWVGCVIALERLAATPTEEVNDGKSTD